MSKFKLLAGLAILAALSACTQPGYGNGGGINANCTLAGAAVGAGLGAVTETTSGHRPLSVLAPVRWPATPLLQLI